MGPCYGSWSNTASDHAIWVLHGALNSVREFLGVGKFHVVRSLLFVFIKNLVVLLYIKRTDFFTCQ